MSSLQNTVMLSFTKSKVIESIRLRRSENYLPLNSSEPRTTTNALARREEHSFYAP